MSEDGWIMIMKCQKAFRTQDVMEFKSSLTIENVEVLGHLLTGVYRPKTQSGHGAFLQHVCCHIYTEQTPEIVIALY